MPTAATYDINARQGNTLRVSFRFKDENGDAVDLTGSLIRFRVELGSRTGEFIGKSSPVQLQMPTPTNGEITLVLSAEETTRLTPGRTNRYEIERRNGGEETTLVAGYVVGIRGVNDNE